jgi:hypothetical protein
VNYLANLLKLKKYEIIKNKKIKIMEKQEKLTGDFIVEISNMSFHKLTEDELNKMVDKIYNLFLELLERGKINNQDVFNCLMMVDMYGDDRIVTRKSIRKRLLFLTDDELFQKEMKTLKEKADKIADTIAKIKEFEEREFNK